jgi:Arc/MetJ family transcription regulator
MRTNIVLDNSLVQEAFHYAKVETKRELVELALREFVENHKRRNILDLRGKIKIRKDYNYKSLRSAEDKD